MERKVNLFELRREVCHVLVGIGFIFIIMFFPWPRTFLFGVLVFGGLISFLSTRFNVPLISKSLSLFERDFNTSFPGRGVLFFFIGSLLSLQLFSLDIAIASILILTFADPVSHFIGQNYGKTLFLNKRKYIEGTILGILVGGIFASFFVSPFLAFVGAFIAMFLESVEVAMAGETIDDNLIIPLVAGSVMYFLSGVVL